MNTISTVIFDLGNVLVNINFEAFPLSLGVERKNVKRADKTAIEQLAIQYETGKVDTENFLHSLEKIFGHTFTREQLLSAWNAIIGVENTPVIPILDDLQGLCMTAILSNTSPTHFQKAFETASVIRKFSKRYLSFEIGAMKPNPAIYNYVIRDLSVEPSSIVFIDDILENVTASEKCGMRGIQFQNVAQLRNDLHELGIL